MVSGSPLHQCVLHRIQRRGLLSRLGLHLPQRRDVVQHIKAAAELKPWGVDVASGVEARPGKKDPEKVQAFVRAVREMDRKTS